MYYRVMSAEISRRVLLGTASTACISLRSTARVKALLGTMVEFDKADEPDLIFDAQSVDDVRLPIWNDSQGTVCVEDTIGNKRAVSWSPTGYVIVENGFVVEYYGTV